MDGILPLWKEKGMTSFDCVFQVRRLLQTKKVGHSGTLDPEVEGVLPICVGKATKVVDYLHEMPKVYRGSITLGYSTETEDATGKRVNTTPVLTPVAIQEIDAAMADMTGNLTQIPPMYSAVKVNGRRLYDYARAGEIVERPKRSVMIYEFKRISDPIYDEDAKTQSWQFEVTCSKGTYVRTLAVDLGQQLGFSAHMSALSRIQSGDFTQEECLTLSKLKEVVAHQAISEVLQPFERALRHYPVELLTEDCYVRVKNGALLSAKEFPHVTQPTRFYYDHTLIALYGPHPSKEGLLKPIKMF